MYYALKLSKYKTALLIAAAFFIALAFAPAMPVSALQGDPPPIEDDDPFGLQDVDAGLGTTLGDPEKGLVGTVISVINILLGLLGLIAVIIILLGGFKWMTAGGNEEKVGEARKLIFAGIIGLAIILSAWAIARFVITSLQTATGGAATPIL